MIDRDHEVDWPLVMAQLHREAPFTALAAAVGISRLSLGMYANGTAAPNHHRGELLLREWCGRLGRRRDQVPVRAARSDGRRRPKVVACA